MMRRAHPRQQSAAGGRVRADQFRGQDFGQGTAGSKWPYFDGRPFGLAAHHLRRVAPKSPCTFLRIITFQIATIKKSRKAKNDRRAGLRPANPNWTSLRTV